MNFKILTLTAPVLLIVSGLCSCSGKGESVAFDDFDVADTLTHHARYLTMADLGNGTVLADIADPWNEGRYLGRYALVHRDSLIPENLGGDVQVIRTPIERAAIFSSIHTAALDELGAIGCVAAIADAAYFAPDDTISGMLRSGAVTDVGSSTAPSAERLAAAGVEAVLRSPYTGESNAALPPSMATVEMADYLETSPIGRAEWILFLGELCGRREKASAIFEEVIDNYSTLVFKASGARSPRPKVLTECEQSGVWYVPAGQSYAARLLIDAGAEWPWADTEGSGSLPLSLEKVAQKAIDADIWLLRTYGYRLDSASLPAQNPRYASFKAVKEGNVYGCDSESAPIFTDMAFHPDRVLAEYVAIFHPDVMPGYTLKYFSR
ncbi:MAG: ABC transporter substrate-binding protein [Muribaculaceae bacterium]|nr:ABC transporter substrate-binding protein [Muribaculaceae bacterium]